MEPKRLGLLHDLAPGVALVGALINPNFPGAAGQAQDIEEAAHAIGQRIVVANANTDDELDGAFASLVREGIGALLVAGAPYFDTRRDRIVAFAARQRLPAIYPFREYAFAGGVVSYGVSITDGYRQVGLYTAKILKGTKPGAEREPGAGSPAGHQRRKRGAVDCTAAQAVAAALLASEMGNTVAASGPRPRLRSGRFSALLTMLRAGLT